MFEPYRPEPYSDFTQTATKSAFELALAGVQERFGAHAPIIIGGESWETGRVIESVNPARPDQRIGTAASAGPSEAEQAIEAAWGAFPSWSAFDASERARFGLKLAALMRSRKYELSAWMVFEAGKNWLEAEADVAEAIDFVEYYSRQCVRLAEPIPVHHYPGEDNESHLLPLGAGVVIPPWNFPLAILVGMVIGPVLAGNTVVVKPASHTPMIGSRWMELVAKAGFPGGVINYLPGAGGQIGDLLVDHPRTRFVNFTGSKEVGLRIAERAAKVHPGQKWLKRAYMEMGGKDATIVDEIADLAKAASEVIKAAFGFQGQKCSACSRLIVVEDVYSEMIDRVADAVARLEVGPPRENYAVGPVISNSQYQAILGEIDRGKHEATLTRGGVAVSRDGGWYLEPTVFADVPPDSRLAQHEIFGPVLSIIKARSFNQALDIANSTEFGLTGGVFSSDRSRIERARREFHVGNLYINRKITGALVGIQPFGGFNMSGSNAKAGGPDYLRLFTEMKTVTERWL